MKQGLLIILSGPSGVGKGTIRQEILKDPSLQLYYSVSMTTRPMRPGEKEGREYYFTDKAGFQKALNEGDLLEWNQYCGNFYGTPRSKVEAMRRSGKNVLLEIDVNGAAQVMKAYRGDPRVVSIFLIPPSFQVLEQRIRGRSTESEEAIQARLEKARVELALQGTYDHVVMNDDLATAAREVASIIQSKSRE